MVPFTFNGAIASNLTLLSKRMYTVNQSAERFDRSIRELLKVNESIQRHSESGFRDLLTDGENDPLDNLYRNMRDKKQENQRLKKEVERLEGRLRKLEKQLRSSEKPEAEERSASQTRAMSNKGDVSQEQTRRLMDSLDVKKNEARQLDQQHQKRMESFVTFLIKCIRYLAKSPAQQGQQLSPTKIIQLQTTINQLRRALDQERQIINNNKLKKLEELADRCKKSGHNEIQFDEMFEVLGLQQEWCKYKLKVQQKKSLISQWESYFSSFQSQSKVGSTKEKENFENSMSSLKSSIDSWKSQMTDVSSVIQTPAYLKQLSYSFNSEMASQKSNFQQKFKQISEVLIQCIRYFFDKLDAFLQRHNQNATRVTTIRCFDEYCQSIQKVVETGHWDSVTLKNKSLLDELFSYIDRRTKFYSSGRMVLRPAS